MSEREEVIDEFAGTMECCRVCLCGNENKAVKDMADEIVRVREQLAAVERERENVSSQLWDCTNERDGYKHRAERMERVVQMLRIASVLPSPDLLTDGDWADLRDAVRDLDAEAQP